MHSPATSFGATLYRSASTLPINSSRVGSSRQIVQRHLSTSQPTQKAGFLDTLRKNRTPQRIHTISGNIGRHVSSASDEIEKPTRFLRMMMFGKPGAGKGTLALRLIDKYDLVTVSTGDLLRQHINERTDIGREAEDIVARGGLIPDEIVLKVVVNKLNSLKNKNWILDGFPRTLGQGELLNAHLNKHNMPLTLVVYIDVADDVIIQRISDRWIHSPSGRVYNMSYSPPKVAGIDDETGEPLTKRPDDNPETFAHRLQTFYETTAPLLNYYHKQAEAKQGALRNSLQHPHQVSFHRPHRLNLVTLSGATSDENWPHLDELARRHPSLRERVDKMNNVSDAIVASGLAAANAYHQSQAQTTH